MKKVIMIILIICFVFLAGCTPNTNTTVKNLDKSQSEEIKTFKIGIIGPFSGDFASIGKPILDVQLKALKDINEKWENENKNKRIEFIIEDAKCSPKDSLTVIQNLVNIKEVKIVLGGICSGETLGAAPYAEANHILMLSSASTGPKVTGAGDYIFRNIGSDSYMGVLIAQDIIKKGYQKVAILSENNDYAQDMRNEIITKLKESNIDISADEIVSLSNKDLKTNMLKIKKSDSQALVIIPASETLAQIFLDYMKSNLNLRNIQLYSVEIMALGNFIEEDILEGLITFKSDFDDSTDKFQKLVNETGCIWGKFCATAYDGVLLMSEMIDRCGEDTDCIKEELYNTQNWQGEYQGIISFDENGDIKEEFSKYEVHNHKLIKIN